MYQYATRLTCHRPIYPFMHIIHVSLSSPCHPIIPISPYPPHVPLSFPCPPIFMSPIVPMSHYPHVLLSSSCSPILMSPYPPHVPLSSSCPPILPCPHILRMSPYPILPVLLIVCTQLIISRMDIHRCALLQKEVILLVLNASFQLLGLTWILNSRQLLKSKFIILVWNVHSPSTCTSPF